VRAQAAELNPPLTYQWFATNVTIIGTDKGSALTFTSPPFGTTAVISVVVTDSDGAVMAASMEVMSISAPDAAAIHFFCNLRKTTGLYNPWWWIETRGGLVPPGPPDPWLQQFGVAVVLADAANRASPQLRGRILEVALEQISLASTAITQQLRALS